MSAKKGNKLVQLAEKDAKKVFDASRKEAKAALAAAKIKFAQAHEAIDKKIETHPDKAVLLAGALGAAVGALAVYAVLKKKK